MSLVTERDQAVKSFLGCSSGLLKSWSTAIDSHKCTWIQDDVYTSQVGFAELKETTNDRANIGGTIIGAPIVGQ